MTLAKFVCTVHYMEDSIFLVGRTVRVCENVVLASWSLRTHQRLKLQRQRQKQTRSHPLNHHHLLLLRCNKPDVTFSSGTQTGHTAQRQPMVGMEHLATLK